MTKIIAIDPGIMSGYCYGIITDGDLKFAPTQATDEVDDSWRRLESFKPDFIVIENFEFRKGSRAGLELFPVQLIGIARLWSLIAPYQCVTYIQSAAMGKGYYTNPVLQKLDFYKRGIPHGIDATRHLLQWFTFGAGSQFAGSKLTEECVSMVELGQVK